MKREFSSGGQPVENPEAEKVLWLPFDETKKTLSFSSDKSVLQKAAEMLESQK